MEKIRQVNQVFFITVVAALIFSAVAGAVPVLQEKQLFHLLSSQLVYAVPMLLYLKRNPAGLKKSLRLRRLRPASILLLVLFAYLITPVLNLINAVSMLFTTNVINASLAGIVTEYPLWTAVGAIALIPGILEECVYRGVFFNEYRKKKTRTGILLSGFLFGLMHMNLNQFFYAFFMGILFALLVEAADSLFASIVVHFTINATSVVVSWAAKDMTATYERQELLQMIRELSLPAAAMAVLAFLVLLLIAALEGRREALLQLFSRQKQGEAGDEKKGETVITLPLLLGTGICILLMLYVELLHYFTL